MRFLEFVGILLVMVLVLRTLVLMLFGSVLTPALKSVFKGSKREAFLNAEFAYGVPLTLAALALSVLGVKVLVMLNYGRMQTILLLVSLTVYAILSHGNKVVSLQSGVPNVPPSLVGVISEVGVYLVFLRRAIWP